MSKQYDPVSHDLSDVELRLATHERTADNHVPNFVHVGENPHALEGYLRLYVRDWTDSSRRDH